VKRFYLQTFGCKLNQSDTAAVRAALRSRGLAEASAPAEAELIVVNTCTVTARADSHARQAIRRLKRLSPRSRLVVTGCYAERDAELLAAMPEVDDVLGLGERGELYRLAGGEAEPPGQAGPFEPEADFGGRTRPYLKIQEGCDMECSYCVVRTVRGPSRSLPGDEVIGRLRALARRGFKEVVLTGTHLGLWGGGRERRENLLDLLRAVDGAEGLPRIRLCSLEPYEVGDELLELMASSRRIARHLHLAVQSGSARILERMRRPPDPEGIRKAVKTARRMMPECGIGADVIVGFPGESDDDFAATVGLLTGAPFTYAHVFSFSPRPGTEAAAMPGRVHTETVTRRGAELRASMKERNYSFRLDLVGCTLPALVLANRDKRGRPVALTDNFIHVSVEAEGSVAPNSLCSVAITGASRGETVGAMESGESPAG